ncbi:Na(+)/H(+) exchange regulatory cofactor NHE-RF4 [Rana temporaria]|uniref:Na(+)/H(+) exchange regulatory cofactor NHE-RF4 n=1 Tax=Rana temporaria TaxID=8407 RepID=UPI001AAC654A|nr:Na(+)/H(+) exchange regulatory cofactor NHE-RF4 [Rana temporaria]
MKKRSEIKEIKEDLKLTTKFPFNPKLGIDNPALCLGEDPGSEPEPVARFCVLRKDVSGTFGFTLRKELDRDGHVVHEVIPGGIAYLVGIKDGDQLLQINGEYVHEQEHLKVVQKVKASGSRVSLVVLDESGYRKLCANNSSPLSILPNVLPESCPRPRLCLVRDEGRGFGFTTTSTGGVRGTFLLNVEDGGAAQKAGVPSGARLLEVSGENVTSFTMSQLSKKLQNSGSRVVLLVLEPSALGVYEAQGVIPSIAFADTSYVPYRTKNLHLVRSPEGYGFLLRQEKCLGGQGQFLRELDPGLPAEVSGMREGDRLLAVNGQSVQDLEHEDIVNLIQQSGNQVSLVVISNEGDRFYTEIGVSPLLFYEAQTVDIVSTHVKESNGQMLQESKMKQAETSSHSEMHKESTVAQNSEE